MPEDPPEDAFDYERMVETALRGVVREALDRAARRGLPGEHHFYLSFRTDLPGVVVPPYLREKYPEQLTIVLQHQFWGLETSADAFSVGLSFGGKPERLTVPFAALTGFADPSVKFGLQFTAAAAAPAAPENPPAPPVPADQPGAAEAKPPAPQGAEIVTLDRFRKR
jgi:uncharacterized protein